MTTSNVAITEGSGKYVAGYSISEDAVTKQLQRIVVNDSSGTEVAAVKTAAAGSAPASGNVVSVQGEAGMTPVIAGGTTLVVDVTLTLDTSAYASGDLLVVTQTCGNVVRINDGTGVLQSIRLIDEDDQGVAMTLYFLNANNSFGTINVSPSISDASARDLLGHVAVAAADWQDLGGVRTAFYGNIGMGIKGTSGAKNIYVAVVNGTGTPTFTASGIKMRMTILCD